MKKLLFVLVVLLSVFLAGCQKEVNELKGELPKKIKSNSYDVNLDEALQIASGYSYAEIGKREGAVTKSLSPKTISSYKTEVNEDGDNIIHIINYTEGGFVIIAADQRLYPILAYSDSNHFPLEEEYSPGVALWIEEMEELIKLVQEKVEEPTNHLLKLWAEVSQDEVALRNIKPDPRCQYVGQPVSGDTRVDTYGPYLTTKWHQEATFNDLLNTTLVCTEAGNNKPYAGCGTIAAAQAMKYYKKPSSYNWDNMPNNIGNVTVQNLIKDIAQAIKITYGCKGSGTTLSNVATALKNTYGYSTATVTSYNFNTVATEMTRGYVTIIQAVDYYSNKGHAWVCDGLEQRYSPSCQGSPDNLQVVMNLDISYLHMNWGGVNGAYNGWFQSGIAGSYWAMKPGVNYTLDREIILVRP